MEKRLFVGSLPYNTTEEELNTLFSEAGTVVSVKIITDRETGQSKGFGFVEMATVEEAQAAIAKFGENYQLGGRTLIVNEAKPLAPRPAGGYGR